jgi:hypothetical protein
MNQLQKVGIVASLALVLIVGFIPLAAIQTANADDKRIKIDLNIKVQNQKGDKGAPGQNGKDGESIVGPTGPAGASGNVTVNVCQVGTSNCVAENVGPNSTLTIFVNASGSVVPGNVTNPEPEPVVCGNGEVLVNGTCQVTLPPIDNGTVIVPDNGTGPVIDNGTVFNGTG